MKHQKSKLAAPLVWIEWEDSGQAIPQWQWLDKLKVELPIKCISVGFLVRDDDKVKAVAISIGDGNNLETAQVSGVIAIPSKCVTRLTHISIPTKR